MTSAPPSTPSTLAVCVRGVLACVCVAVVACVYLSYALPNAGVRVYNFSSVQLHYDIHPVRVSAPARALTTAAPPVVCPSERPPMRQFNYTVAEMAVPHRRCDTCDAFGFQPEFYGVQRQKQLRHFPAECRCRGNVVLIHKPKTGGMTLGVNLNVSRTSADKHWTAQRHRGAYGRCFEHSLRVGVVRNPWDMLVSLYHFLAERVASGHIFTWSPTYNHSVDALPPAYRYSHTHNFTDWARVLFDERADMGDWMRHYAHIDGYDQYFNDERGVNQLDYIIDFDNFVDGFVELSAFLQCAQCRRMRALNRSKHKHYAEYYDDDTRELVRRHYARTIRRFGYTFE